MLINLKEQLAAAKNKKYAVGSFNVYSLETIKGVLACANRLEAPVIVAFGASYLENMDLQEVAFAVSHRAKDVDSPVVLHLDHCRDLGVIRKAVEAGFTSVMYDGSHLPYQENAENTSKAVELARAVNASVEAELGSLAKGKHSAESELGDRERFTDPIAARDFAERTGIDALAVSIGTVHGMYKGEPNIRIDILKEINSIVSVPLVLHGGSGTPAEILRSCIANGICKINVNTEISQHAVEKVSQAISADPNIHLSRLSLCEQDAVGEIVEKYINLFLGR